MLTVCVSGFFILLGAGSLLFWATLVVAKRADYELQGRGDVMITDIPEEKPPFTALIPSQVD